MSENGETKPGSYVAFFHDRSKVLTWIRDSIAMFTRPAKRLTSVYYGRSPKKMYYAGCSTGGAQGFALAQFHPRVFDGIVAGCPGNWYSHLILSFLFNGVNSNVSISNTHHTIVRIDGSVYSARVPSSVKTPWT